MTNTPHPLSLNARATGDTGYRRWSAMKLDSYVGNAGDCTVEICDPGQISKDEQKRITELLRSNNFFVYQYNQDVHGNAGYLAIARQLGLIEPVSNPGSGDQGVSLIQVVSPGESKSDVRQGYIPYSSSALNWHTDGYYNEESRKVRSFLLHCENPAEIGGESSLLDHELVYAWMRSHHPELCAALEDGQCLTIPGNTEPGVGFYREAYRGPVFEEDALSGTLYMRFTQRKRNVHWQSDPLTIEAVTTLNNLLDSETLPVITLKLERGQGIVCNNVLHCRTGFSDADGEDNKRCLHRIRYKGRVVPGDPDL